jgi:lysophospholipase L1-like esterase
MIDRMGVLPTGKFLYSTGSVKPLPASFLMHKLVLLAISVCLALASSAAPKKKPKGKGKAGPPISAKAQALLKKTTISLSGKVGETVNKTFYLDPDQKFRPTNLWGLDLPNVINGTSISGVVGRKVTITFTGEALARPGDQIKFMPKLFTGIKALDGKPLPKAKRAPPKKTQGGAKNQKAQKKPGKKPAAAGKLPRVLILGDSVSIGYTHPVRQGLTGKAIVLRPIQNKKGVNCLDTANGLENIKTWLGKSKWDLVLFNFGLEDIKAGTSVQDYAKALEQIAKQLQGTDAQVVFATTTFPSHAKQITAYNAAAARIMDKLDIEILDLHSFAKPQMAKLSAPDKAQFSKAGSGMLAKRVGSKIRTALGITTGKAR